MTRDKLIEYQENGIDRVVKGIMIGVESVCHLESQECKKKAIEAIKKYFGTSPLRKSALDWADYYYYSSRPPYSPIDGTITRSDLDRLIYSDAPELYYQPYFEAESLFMAGQEALIRLRANGRVIPAKQFIGVAEEFELIRYIDLFTVETLANKGIRASVNLSIDSIKNRKIRKLLEDYSFEVEISARNPIVKDDRKILEELADRGVRFILDDFGEKFANIELLPWLPISQVKLGSFAVKILQEDFSYYDCLKKLISAIKSCDLKVCAKGIETKEELDLFRSIGVDLVQGYLLGKPENSPHV